jgi:molybdopterin synthase sulfur carrier subunit
MVRYFASARAVSGVAEEPLVATTVDDVLLQVGQRHGVRMAAILSASSFLLDGLHVHDTGVELPAVAELDILPPFAGG